MKLFAKGKYEGTGVATLLLVALFSLVPSCGQAPEDLSGADLDGTLVFVSSHSGNAEIYALRLPGGTPTRLTFTDAEERTPTWSPDGEQIAFSNDADGDAEIYVMNRDGSGVRQLTDNHVWDSSPSWAPDGERIAFARNLHPRQDEGFVKSDIYVMGTDGDRERVIADETLLDLRPDWSPDGESIAFEGHLKLYVADVRSGAATRVMTDQLAVAAPRWSPDGRRILFTGGQPGRQTSRPYVIDRNGSNLRVLGEAAGSLIGPSWSPDGESVVYSRSAETDDIFITALRGGEDPVQVTHGLQVESAIDWF